MNDINVVLVVLDKCCCKCCSSINQTEKILTSTNDFITLQDGYTLNLISVNNSFALISIGNGIIHFVRKIYLNVPILICLPNCNCEHILKIQANSL